MPGQAVCGPEQEDRFLLDHGLQSAHPRGVGQRAPVQRPSTHGKDLRAGQQPLLPDRPALGLRYGQGSGDFYPLPVGGPGGEKAHAPRLLRAGLATTGGNPERKGRLPCRTHAAHAQGRQDELLLAAMQQQHAGRTQHQRGDVSRLAQSGQLHHRLRSLSDGLRPGGGSGPAHRHVGREGGCLRQR